MDNLQSGKHYKIALSRVWELIENYTKTQAEEQEIETLVTLLETYEDIQVPMQSSEPSV